MTLNRTIKNRMVRIIGPNFGQRVLELDQDRVRAIGQQHRGAGDRHGWLWHW